MKPPKLDPRRSRKLTSRECSSILGAFLGGMATSDLIGPEQAREGLKIWAECPEIWEHVRFQSERKASTTAAILENARALQADGADPALRAYWRGLGAVISGLRTVSHEKAVRAAVQWCYARDDFWAPFKNEGRRPLSEES